MRLMADKINWDEETNIVVVGAGAAGLAASIEVADRSMSVLVLEKFCTPFASSSALSGNIISFAETDLQKENGINDSKDFLYEDLMRVGNYENDSDLVQLYVDNQLNTYHWLNGFGIKFDRVMMLGGMSVPRAHVPYSKNLMRVLKEVAEKREVRFFFETKAERLVQDEKGEVIGIRVQGKEKVKFIKARKAIILSTGGFGRSPEKLQGQIDLNKVKSRVCKGHRGDGHTMAQELGAGFRDLPYVKPDFGIHVTGKTAAFIFNYGAIIVNKEGKRFVNESINVKDIGLAVLRQPQAIGIQIFDSEILNMAIGSEMEEKNPVVALTSKRSQLLTEANTIEELGRKIGVLSQVLSETVERYNRYTEEGNDLDFGRNTAIAGTNGKLRKINTPPIYAFESMGILVGTYAGITVDNMMRVKNVFGETIPRLYAAGEIVGGFHGAGYMAGTALGKAIIFGRIAGISAAREAG